MWTSDGHHPLGPWARCAQPRVESSTRLGEVERPRGAGCRTCATANAAVRVYRQPGYRFYRIHWADRDAPVARRGAVPSGDAPSGFDLRQTHVECAKGQIEGVQEVHGVPTRSPSPRPKDPAPPPGDRGVVWPSPRRRGVANAKVGLNISRLGCPRNWTTRIYTLYNRIISNRRRTDRS